MASRRAISAVARHLRHPPLATSAVAARRDLQDLFVRSIGCAAPKCCFPLDLFSTPSGFRSADLMPYGGVRGFSSPPEKSSDDDNEEEDEGDDEDEDEDEEVEEGEFEDDDGDVLGAPKRVLQSGKSEEEKRKEATEIGYQVLGPLSSSENPFKPYEPVFAVVQVGSHQFKVSNGDSIFTERLKYCEVNEKLVLNKVLMLGSKSQTVVGRPILPEASVHAVVEEHALDAKVIIFKKKRRKNYRRTKGHRQELTKLRITDIQGIVKSEDVAIAA